MGISNTLVFLLLLPLSSFAADYQVSWGEKIPMRDGVALNATIYRPVDQSEPLPVVFTMTPYISDSYHDRAEYFSSNGYIYALVDVRGRGNSEGVFTPFANDPGDGHDVVEWLATQDHANGKVAMWGGSYAGYNQWMTASRLPEHLSTIVPAASPWLGVDFPMWKNIFGSYTIRWITLTSGVTPNSRLFGESNYWNRVFYRRYTENLPFRSLDQLAGNANSTFQEWLKHPSLDDYWSGLNPSAKQYEQINMPILSITGHHDGDQPGALRHYEEHMRMASAAARDQHYLIIGPWNHAGTRTPNNKFGGLTFAENSNLDLNDLHRQWYDWTMKDGGKPEFLKDRVAYFVSEAGEWRYAPTLEAVADDSMDLFLASDGKANSVFSSGSLQAEAPAKSPADHYQYDPLDLSFGEFEKKDNDNYLLDQTWVVAQDGKGLVYHSDPLADSIIVAGRPKLSLWMSIDQADTDFAVGLYEIRSDGQSLFIGSDLVRARYRESLEQAKPVVQGKPLEYVFDGFYWGARNIRKGSRLRLHITSPNSIHLQKNYNSGGLVADETASDARLVTVTLFHDAQHPSRLELPITVP